MKTHKDLIVWKTSISMVSEIYKITRLYPKEELYCIVSQIRRAAVSILANIAEGCTRKSTKEYLQFLYVSLGSATELDTHLIISHNLNFIPKDDFLRLQDIVNEIRRMLLGLIKAIRGSRIND